MSRRATGMAAAAAAIVIAACGGSTVTRQNVIARGNAICTRSLRDIRSVPQPGGAGSLSGLSTYLRQVLPIIERETAQLRALPRPAAGRSLLDRYIAAATGDEALYRALAAAARSDDRAAVAQAEAGLQASPTAALAARYGLSQCGTPGSTALS